MPLLVLELQPAGLQLVNFTTDALELFGLLAQLVVCESAAVHVSFYCLFEFFQLLFLIHLVSFDCPFTIVLSS